MKPLQIHPNCEHENDDFWYFSLAKTSAQGSLTDVDTNTMNLHLNL